MKPLNGGRKAADQNKVEAEDALGQFYFEQGDTPHRSAYGPALKWLRKAAEQGYVGSMNNLGAIYDAGLGVKEDWREAAKWYPHRRRPWKR